MANLLEIERQYKTVDKIPAELIFERSKDGKAVVLLDGTKVSKDLIEKAKTDAARAAAAAHVPAALSGEVIEGFITQLSKQTDRIGKLEATVESLQRDVAALKGK